MHIIMHKLLLMQSPDTLGRFMVLLLKPFRRLMLESQDAPLILNFYSSLLDLW